MSFEVDLHVLNGSTQTLTGLQVTLSQRVFSLSMAYQSQTDHGSGSFDFGKCPFISLSLSVDIRILTLEFYFLYGNTVGGDSGPIVPVSGGGLDTAALLANTDSIRRIQLQCTIYIDNVDRLMSSHDSPIAGIS